MNPWLDAFRRASRENARQTIATKGDNRPPETPNVAIVANVRRTFSTGDAAAWQVLHRQHIARIEVRTDDTFEQAAVAAFDRLVSDWHREHGAPPPEGVCAGCGGPLSGSEAYSLHDGARLHGDACLARYGERWRAAAADALARLGIARPEG